MGRRDAGFIIGPPNPGRLTQIPCSYFFGIIVVNKDARTKAVSSRPSSRSRKGSSSNSGSTPSSSAGQAGARPRSAKAALASARRTWFVLAGLAGALAVAGALLKVLAPPPLAPDATASLFAVSQGNNPPRTHLRARRCRSQESGRWRAIYVHQSLTTLPAMP